MLQPQFSRNVINLSELNKATTTYRVYNLQDEHLTLDSLAVVR